MWKINPFKGKRHSDEFKRKLSEERKGKWYIGEKNPMYGKTPYNIWVEKFGKEYADKRWSEWVQRIGESTTGKKNGFYGKKHSLETINVIREKNKIYREKNKENILQKSLIRLGIDKIKLSEMLEYYVNELCNKDTFENKFNIDFRTAKKYWFRTKLITEKKLKTVMSHKKMYSNESVPEKQLYQLLCDKYGIKNVQQHYELSGYYYDVCIFNKILIEYDGYYWHEIIKNKNDIIKNSIAKKFGYHLYRVKENEKRIPINKNEILEQIDICIENIL